MTPDPTPTPQPAPSGARATPPSCVPERAAAALPAWLPARLFQADYADAAAMEVAAYAVFQRDWATCPIFRGDEVRAHRHPHKANANRWYSYWHCVTEGKPEDMRVTPMSLATELVSAICRFFWSTTGKF